MDFVSLHSHSTFSYGDGYGPVEDHVARVADLGMTALAMTDHGNTSSHVQLEKNATKYGIKPIYGCEIYLAPKNMRDRKITSKCHQTVLARNVTGLQNLNRMVSESWDTGFYMYPSVDGPMLKKYADGLVVTSGCADSLLSSTLLGGKWLGPKRLDYTSAQFQATVDLAMWYQRTFGENYYLEVQRFPGLERCRVLNPAFEQISRITGIPLVATADVHYPLPTDNKLQTILHAAHRGGTVESTEASWEYDILLTYPTSDDEVMRDLLGTGLSQTGAQAALENTGIIADGCTVVLPRSEQLRYPRPDEYDSAEDMIWAWLRDGWTFRWKSNERMRANKQAYIDRIKYEMGPIAAKDFCDYFLVLSHVVRWAKDRKIPVGPARGSAAASLVCYMLRITEVDPLQFPTMVFERFIDLKRSDLPDVDLDFSDDRRDEVRQECVRLFGADRVGNIANFTRYRGKNSIDDVARVYGIPKWETETAKKMIISRSGGDSRQNDSLQDTFDTFPAAKAVLDKYPQLAYAMDLEGNYRGLGVHAAGLVISNAPINEVCATYVRKSGKHGNMLTVLAYDKKDAEYLGMLKADFLGLSTMGMIGLALDQIGMDLEELYRVPLTDPVVLAAFKRNDVVGIFQFEGRATRQVCLDVSPDNFMHLADINALSRPGPLFSGMTAAYVEVKHGRADPEELHPLVDAVTSWTNGQIVYQEQVLKIIAEVGGFPVTKVGDIRKIISQKLGEASFEKMHEEFNEGAMRLHGISDERATRIWKFMVTSATYSFNVAHCVSYSMLAFWCMWLKLNHPEAFYAAQLEKTDPDNWPRLMRDAMAHGVTVKAPQIGVSARSWSGDIAGHAVVAGYSQIHGVGPAISQRIYDFVEQDRVSREMNGAEDHAPMTWDDLIEVPGIGEKTIQRIVDFCESDDPFELHRTGIILDGYRNEMRLGYADWAAIPRPTHTSTNIPRRGEHNVTWMGIVKEKNYQDYVENQRTRTGDEIEDIIKRMKDPHLVKSCVLRSFDDGEEDVYVRFNRWQFPRFKEAIDSLQPGRDVIIVKGRKREDFGVSIHVQTLTVINPEEDS